MFFYDGFSGNFPFRSSGVSPGVAVLLLSTSRLPKMSAGPLGMSAVPS